MKMIVAVVLALVAASHAASVASPVVIDIIRSSFKQDPSGSYDFVYETGNGIVRTENGELKEALDEENKPHTVVAVRGSYAYPREDGTVEKVDFYADETGYHAEGDSIPKAPVTRR